MHMEPTEVMMLGKLGAAVPFGRDPQWRANFMNPPTTTAQYPQNLMRQTVMNGLGHVPAGLGAGNGAAGGAWRVVSMIGSLGGTALGAFHGYKRSGQKVWPAIGWALLGGMFWPIVVPVIYVQGVGKKKRKRR